MTDEVRQNPMHRLPDWRETLPMAQAAPRCHTRTRSGGSCGSAAMRNGRCRMHGGCSTGPRTAEGVERIRQARTRHGRYAASMGEVQAVIRELKRIQRHLLQELE